MWVQFFDISEIFVGNLSFGQNFLEFLSECPKKTVLQRSKCHHYHYDLTAALFFILQFSHWEMCSQHPVIKSQELNQHLTALRWRKSNPTRWWLPLCNSKRRGRVTFFVSPWRKSWHGTENGVLNIQIAREFAADFQWKICSMNCQREEYKWLWHFLQCGLTQIGI